MPKETKKKTTAKKTMTKATKPKIEATISAIVKEDACRECGLEMRKLLWDSREGEFKVIVCDNRECILYRQFQGSEGTPLPRTPQLV